MLNFGKDSGIRTLNYKTWIFILKCVGFYSELYIFYLFTKNYKKFLLGIFIVGDVTSPSVYWYYHKCRMDFSLPLNKVQWNLSAT